MSRREDSPRPAPPGLAWPRVASRSLSRPPGRGVGPALLGRHSARPAPPGPRMRQAIYAAAAALAREPEPRAGPEVSGGEAGPGRPGARQSGPFPALRERGHSLACGVPGQPRVRSPAGAGAARAVGAAFLQSGPAPWGPRRGPGTGPGRCRPGGLEVLRKEGPGPLHTGASGHPCPLAAAAGTWGPTWPGGRGCGAGGERTTESFQTAQRCRRP